MIVFIPDNYNFSVDLTHLKLTFNEQNPVLSKEFSAEYSFPFSMSLDYWVKISNLHQSAADRVTRFPGKLNVDGKISSATLKIDNKQGQIVNGIILSGAEVISSFETPLKDLPLDDFTVENLKEHALTIINNDWPEVNYNFPMIHTDNYDPESEEFFEFEKIFNKFSEGAFVENELNVDEVDSIKNIMQPFPYLLHIVKKIFEAAGKTLEGDILEDSDLKTALVIRDGKYYDSLSKEDIPYIIKNAEHEGVVYVKSGLEHVYFSKDYTVAKKGDYILFGEIVFLFFRSALFGPTLSDMTINITVISGGVPTLIYNWESFGSDDEIPMEKKIRIKNIDIPISLEVDDIIRIEKIEPRRDQLPTSVTPEYPDAVYLSLVPVRYRNPDDSPILSLLDLNKIDLSLCVPDMKSGDLIDIIRVWKNLGLVESGNIVTMNYVNVSDRSAAIPLSKYEVEEPLQSFKDERSFELLFADGKANTTYRYDSLLIKKGLVTTNDYTNEKTTTPISIDALPLPVIEREGVRTAIAFDNETSKLRLAFYKAPDAGEPTVCYENQNMLIPGIYALRYLQWINFMLNSTPFEWEFIVSVEHWREISAQSIIYAYDNFHLFSEIEKERISMLYWRISAKTETLS